MLRLSLFEIYSSEFISKGNQVLLLQNTHGGFLTHLALPSYLWHVFSNSATPNTPLSKYAETSLCSTLLLFRYTTPGPSKFADRQDNKKPESLKAAVSGSLHKLG